MLLRADNTCPACTVDFADPRGVDPTRTEVTIGALRRLPPFCMVCGSGASHYQPLGLTRTSPDEEALSPLRWLVGGIWGLMWRLGAEARREYMQLSIPTCRACAKAGREPVLRQIDWDTSTAIALVHADFKARMREAGYS